MRIGHGKAEMRCWPNLASEATGMASMKSRALQVRMQRMKGGGPGTGSHASRCFPGRRVSPVAGGPFPGARSSNSVSSRTLRASAARRIPLRDMAQQDPAQTDAAPDKAVDAVNVVTPPPPESSQSITTRRLVILSFWAVAILLGLPLWFKTTTIYRASLPLQQMLDWADGKVWTPQPSIDSS